MIDRRLLILGLPTIALGLYVVPGLVSNPEVEFTRPAPAASASVDLRPNVSTAYLELPVDLQRVAARTQSAVAQRLATSAEPAVADPACARKPGTPECAAPRAEGHIEQAGPVGFEVQPRGVKIKVPLRLVENAQQGSGHVLAANFTFTLAVRQSEAGGFEIVRQDDIAAEAQGVSPAASQSRLLRQAEIRLRPAILAAHDELRQALTTLPLVEATEQTWNAMSEPLELGKGSGLWLRSVPELVGSGQLVASQGQARFRIPIAARLSLEESGRAPPSPKRPVIHGHILTNTGSNIRFATALPLANIQRAASAALIKAGPLEMKPDRFGPAVKATIHQVRAYPSIRQIGFELDTTVSRFEGETFRGKAHLVGRPHLDAAARLVTLVDIALTTPPARETGATNKQHQNAPRLSAEPLAARLTDAARFDLSRDLSEAVPRFSGQLHQQLANRLAMSAAITQATPISVETSRDGAWLVADLGGELIFTYERPGSIAISASKQVSSPASNQTQRSTAPEVVSAAVVSAATATAVGQTLRPAAFPASPSAAAGGAAVQPRSPVSPAPAAATPVVKAATPAPKAAASPAVKAKVLASRPKSGTGSAKVAAKANWVPFGQ